MLGGRFGPIGSTIGGMAGDLISKITGVGDYRVSSNSIVEGQAVPSFVNSGDGMEICHREYLYDVTGSTDFSLLSLNINPGLSTTFPWLSRVAANFEEYEMLGLVFEYRPTSGSIATTSAALGVVVYATNYDVLDPLFTSKQQMDSYEYSSSTVPFDKMLHAVECASTRNPLHKLYVRYGDAPTGSDLRMYDMGMFQYATKGMQSAYAVGELWVTYHVRLSKPRLPLSPTEAFYEAWASSGNCTVADPVGTGMALNPLVASGNTLGAINEIVASGAGFFNVDFNEPRTWSHPALQQCNYAIVKLSLIFTGATITSAPNFTGQGPAITYRNYINNNGNSYAYANDAASGMLEVYVAVQTGFSYPARTISFAVPATITLGSFDLAVGLVSWY